MPKPREIPSLDFLKGFDAAARHLSFTQAAAEMFLTQSALSRQIKALEEQIGHPLFVRGHRELSLTEAGKHCSLWCARCWSTSRVAWRRSAPGTVRAV